MVHDLDHATVTLDKGQALGLMGYPDILGKWVHVDVPGGHSEDGMVYAVGPLGFVITTTLPVVVPISAGELEARTSGTVGRPVVMTGTRTTWNFFPWSAAIVTWVADEPSEPDGQGNAAPAAAVTEDA